VYSVDKNKTNKYIKIQTKTISGRNKKNTKRIYKKFRIRVCYKNKLVNKSSLRLMVLSFTRVIFSNYSNRNNRNHVNKNYGNINHGKWIIRKDNGLFFY